MGRHEIRLRRQRMTSRRIDNHKNFMDVLQEHERTTRTKRLIKLLLLLAFFIGMMSFLYYVLMHTGPNKSSDKKTAQTEIIYSPQQMADGDFSTKTTPLDGSEIRS